MDWERTEKGIFKRGKRYYICLTRNGRTHKERVPDVEGKEPRRSDARRLLNKRISQLDDGLDHEMRPSKALFDDLAEDYLASQEAQGKKSLRRIRISTSQVLDHFKGRRARLIQRPQIDGYIRSRRNRKTRYGRHPASATINREVQVIHAILKLGYENGKLHRLPVFPKRLREAPPREGFFEEQHFFQLMDALPSYLRALIATYHTTGMRRAEVLDLAWAGSDEPGASGFLNLEEGTIRLRAEKTKTGRSRVVFLTPELLEMLEEQRATREMLSPNFSFVFFREEGGRICRIRDFRYAWRKALEKAGLDPKMRIHDFRRTAIRNMTRAGIQDIVAMRISGHRTRSVFDRYNIVSEADLKDAAEKMATVKSPNKSQFGGDGI